MRHGTPRQRTTAPMTPTINVNLTPCNCEGIPTHAGWCSGAPVLIPCPIPRSVTLEVAAGTCTCLAGHDPSTRQLVHSPNCPARPIRVTCSVGGETWEQSEVTKTSVLGWGAAMAAAQSPLPACRERWALVKALVLRHSDLSSMLTGPKAVELLSQRDAVFAALCAMARAEEAARSATERLWYALPDSAGWVSRHPARDEQTPSALLLAAYTSHLISQIGVL